MKKIISYIIYNFFRFLKLRNRVILFCFDGDFIGDNIFYIIEKLKTEKIDYKFVASKKFTGVEPCVKKYSIKFFLYYYSSKTIVTNTNIPTVCYKKKGQIYINTWHGAGGLKGYRNIDYNYNIFDYFLSESEFDSVNFRNSTAWNYKNEILKIGMPRNDIFYKKNIDFKEIKKKIGISNDVMVILYAPTMRECSKSIFIEDFSTIVKNFEKKFGKKAILLIRNHHYQYKFGDKIKCNDNALCIDVSSYHNMQELLYISDVLITDYSSCAWDFSLMYKPVFLYAVDYYEYILGRGNSFIDYNLLPYSVSYNIEELCNSIVSFKQEDYKEKLEKYFKYVKKYDVKGDSTDLLIKLIKTKMEK